MLLGPRIARQTDADMEETPPRSSQACYPQRPQSAPHPVPESQDPPHVQLNGTAGPALPHAHPYPHTPASAATAASAPNQRAPSPPKTAATNASGTNAPISRTPP